MEKGPVHVKKPVENVDVLEKEPAHAKKPVEKVDVHMNVLEKELVDMNKLVQVGVLEKEPVTRMKHGDEQ